MATSRLFSSLVSMVAAVILAACVVVLMAKAEPASAAFPGKNGKIAFVREGARDSHIFTINPDGSGLRKISTKPRFDSSPSWSPDGKKIAFSGVLQGNWDVYVINANGSRLKRITKSRAGDFSPSWSPDGKKIAFVRQRGEKGPNTVCESCIYKIRVDGTGLKRLTGAKGFASDPAWSPNGKKIAYSQFVRRVGGQIFKMNAADGTQKRNLAKTRLQESEPNWSPDGKKIAYTSFTESHGAFDRVFTMNADGSNQKNLTKQVGGWSPAWSPNGKKIVFSRDDIYVMKSDGTKVERLTNNPGFGEGFDATPDWQPLPPLK